MANMLTYMVTLLCYLVYLIFPCESQTITVKPSGAWTEGTSVTLTCNISSWLGEMEWRLGSKIVAKCTPVTCSTLDTGEGAFLFGFDTVNHIFTWTVNPVKTTHIWNAFNCYDGAKTVNFIATDIKTTTTLKTVNYATGISSIVLAPIAAVVGLVALIIAIYICKSQNNAIDQRIGQQLIAINKTVNDVKVRQDVMELKIDQGRRLPPMNQGHNMS